MRCDSSTSSCPRLAHLTWISIGSVMRRASSSAYSHCPRFLVRSHHPLLCRKLAVPCPMGCIKTLSTVHEVPLLSDGSISSSYFSAIDRLLKISNLNLTDILNKFYQNRSSFCLNVTLVYLKQDLADP